MRKHRMTAIEDYGFNLLGVALPLYKTYARQVD